MGIDAIRMVENDRAPMEKRGNLTRGHKSATINLRARTFTLER
jgi:hypothetical protein